MTSRTTTAEHIKSILKQWHVDKKEEEPEYCPHGKPENHYCSSCGCIEQAEMRGEYD